MPNRRRLSREQDLQVIAQYLSGKECPELATLYGVSTESIRRRLIEAKIERRSPKDRRHYKLNTSFFKNIERQEQAYWLGFLAADGYVRHGNLQICLAVRDKDHLCAFASAIDTDCPVRVRYAKNHGWRSIFELSSVDMTADLTALGVFQRKTKVLVYPKLRPDLNRHFIRGYFDGDGTINLQKQPTFSIIGTAPFLERCSEIFYEERITRRKRILYPHPVSEDIYSLDVGGSLQFAKLRNWLYQDSTIWLPRKRNKFEQAPARYSDSSHQVQ